MTAPLPGIGQHGIEVDAQSVWCQKHKAVVFLDPNRRFDLASVRLFDYAVRDDRIKMACGWDPITGARADPAKLTAAIKDRSPLCCFVGDAILGRVYREAYYGLFQQAQSEMIRNERLAGRLADARGHH